MSDPSVWQAIAELRSLLELVPDTAGMSCRFDTCITWVRQTVEADLFPQASPAAGRKATNPWGIPGPDEPDPEPTSAPVFVRFPYENAREGESLWWTDQPWQVINQTVARLRPHLAELFAVLDLDATHERRIRREIAYEGDFLEEDTRGTIQGFLDRNDPADPDTKRRQTRNNARLDALAEFVRVLRANPEVVLRFAADIVARAQSALAGWAFDVPGGTVACHGKTYAELSPEVVLFMKVVVDAAPNYKSFDDFKAIADAEKVSVGAVKIDHIKKQIPAELRALFEVKKGVGTRLKS